MLHSARKIQVFDILQPVILELWHRNDAEASEWKQHWEINADSVENPENYSAPPGLCEGREVCYPR